MKHNESEWIASQIAARDRRWRNARKDMPLIWMLISVGVGLIGAFITAAILERIG